MADTDDRIYQQLLAVLSSIQRLEGRVSDIDTRTKNVEQLVHDLTETEPAIGRDTLPAYFRDETATPANCSEAQTAGLYHSPHPWTTYQHLLRIDSLSDAMALSNNNRSGSLDDMSDDDLSDGKPDPCTLQPGPCAEGMELSRWSAMMGKLALDRGLFRPQGSMRTLLSAPTVVDRYFEDETNMWLALKSGPFCRSVRMCSRKGRPLNLADWLRLLLVIPFTISVHQLVRVFDEEDTITALTSIVSIEYYGFWDLPYLLLAAPMHPQSRLRVRWDTYILIILFTVCIFTPYMICFDVQVSKLTAFGVWETIVDASFLLDIVLNFRTAFVENGASDALISSRRRIITKYLTGFFVLDVVSTVPWDLVMTNEALGLVQLFKVSRIVKLVRIMRILKLIRILRLLKAPTILKQLEERLGRVIVRIGSLTCTVIFILHIFACVFHYVALLDERNGTWVELSGIVDQNSKWDRYVTAMYWAMSTMATVGYGDVTPIQVPEKLVAMAGMMIGVTVFAYIMGTVSSLLSSFNAQSMRSQERQQQLDSFCRTHKIPPALTRKLSQYYERVLGKQVHQEDLELVSGLSSALRQQVLLILHAEIFDKIPFFKDKHPQFLEQLIPHLKLEFYAASDYVLWEEDISTEMYFIVEGMLEVRVNIAARTSQAEPEEPPPRAAASPSRPHAAQKRHSTAALRSDATFRKVATKWHEQRKSALMLQQQSFNACTDPPGPLAIIRQPLSYHVKRLRHWVSSNGEARSPSRPGGAAPPDGARAHASAGPAAGPAPSATSGPGPAAGRAQAGAPHLQNSDSSLSDATSTHDGAMDSETGAVFLEASHNPFAAGTKARAGQEDRSPRRSHSISRHWSGNAVAPEPGPPRRTFSLGRNRQSGAGASDAGSQVLGLQMQRKRAQKHIVDRMIGIQATPFKRIGRLDAGRYFGEVSCWTGARRTASVVAITSAELFSLQRVALLAIAATWPEVATELRFQDKDAPEQLNELKAKSLAGEIPAQSALEPQVRSSLESRAQPIVPPARPSVEPRGTRRVSSEAATDALPTDAPPAPPASGEPFEIPVAQSGDSRVAVEPAAAAGRAGAERPRPMRHVSFRTASRREEWGIDIDQVEPEEVLAEL
eukprot:jgi/Ulvmu1/10939/UM007_0118.1